MKVDLKGSFSDLLLLQQLVTLLSSLVPATVELYNTIQLPCFERSFVMLKISFQCLLYKEVLGPCALHHGYMTTYLWASMEQTLKHVICHLTYRLYLKR